MTDFRSLKHFVTNCNHEALMDIMQESHNLRTTDCMGSITDCSITRNLNREHNYFSENFKQNVVFPNDFMEQNGRSSSSDADSFISDISLIQDPISDDTGIESLLSTSVDSKITLTDPCYHGADESSLSGSLDISKMPSSFDKSHFEVSSPDSAFSEGSLNDFESDDNNTGIENLINQLMSNSGDLQSDISNYLQSEIPPSEEIASFDIDTFFSSDLMNGDLFSGDPNASICASSYRETPNLFDNKLKPLFDDFVSSSKDIAESSDIPEPNSGSGTFDHGYKSSSEQSLFGSSSADMFESTNYFDDMDYPIPMVSESPKASESIPSSSSSSSTFSAPSPTLASSSSSSSGSNSSSSSSSSYSRNILLTCRKQINCFREPESRFSTEHSYHAPKLFVKSGSKSGSLSKKLQAYSHDKDKDKEGRTNSRVRLQSHSDPSVVPQRHSDYNQIKASRSSKKKDVFATPENPGAISKGSCLRKVLTGHLSHPLSSTSSNSASNQRQPTFVQSASIHRKNDSRYFGNVHTTKETASQISTTDPKKHIFKTPLPSQALRNEREDVSELEKYLRGMIPLNGDNTGQSSSASSSKNWNGGQKTNTSFLYKLLTGEISQELYREIDRKLRETETASMIS